MTNNTTDRFLDTIGVATPCSASWGDMTGDDRVRHCGQCKLNVYNLSEMTGQQATELVTQTEGRICVRFFRRGDGTVITKDCPVGIAALKRRARLAYARVAALLGIVCSGLFGCGPRDSKPEQDPGRTLQGEVQVEMGDVMCPAPPPRQLIMGKMMAPASTPKPGPEKDGEN